MCTEHDSDTAVLSAKFENETGHWLHAITKPMYM